MLVDMLWMMMLVDMLGMMLLVDMPWTMLLVDMLAWCRESTTVRDTSNAAVSIWRNIPKHPLPLDFRFRFALRHFLPGSSKLFANGWRVVPSAHTCAAPAHRSAHT